MAGAGVVPRVRALLRGLVQNFVQFHPQARIQLAEQDSQRGTHDSGADEYDVWTLVDFG